MAAHGERSRQSGTKTRPGDKTALKALNQLADQAQRLKYPEIRPELLAPFKFSDKTANGLTGCIIAFLRVKGMQAERINCTGRQIDKRQTYTDVLGHTRQIGSLQWIPTNGTRGTADISATINGLSVKIEVKAGRDYQRPAQKEYQKQVEAAKGIYFIATSFDQFYQWYLKTFE